MSSMRLVRLIISLSALTVLSLRFAPFWATALLGLVPCGLLVWLLIRGRISGQ